MRSLHISLTRYKSSFGFFVTATYYTHLHGLPFQTTSVLVRAFPNFPNFPNFVEVVAPSASTIAGINQMSHEDATGPLIPPPSITVWEFVNTRLSEILRDARAKATQGRDFHSVAFRQRMQHTFKQKAGFPVYAWQLDAVEAVYLKLDLGL